MQDLLLIKVTRRCKVLCQDSQCGRGTREGGVRKILGESTSRPLRPSPPLASCPHLDPNHNMLS